MLWAGVGAALVGAGLLGGLGRAAQGWFFQWACLSLAALGVHALWRDGGLFSFGQAVLSALGGYALIAWLRAVPSPHAALLACGPLWAGLAAAAGAAVLGLALARLQGMAFAMVSLALAECVATLALAWPQASGGEAGWSASRAVSGALLGWRGQSSAELAALAGVYLVLGGLLVALWRRSVWAVGLGALRDAPLRSVYLGLHPLRLRLGAWVGAGFLAGVSGALLALDQEHIGPQAFGSEHALALVVAAVLGGRSAIGPLWGAALWVAGSGWLAQWTPAWSLILGLLLWGLVWPRAAQRRVSARALSPGAQPQASPPSQPHRPESSAPHADASPASAPPAAPTAAPAQVGGSGALLLAVQALALRYGPVMVLRGVDLQLRAGEIVALIGPNGAGKTSLFDAICGAQPLHGGRVTLAGRDLAGWTTEQRVQAGLGRSFQNASAWRGRRVGELLQLAVSVGRSLPWRSAHTQAQAQSVARSWGLLACWAQDVAALSYGQARCLELALAGAGAARVLLLDEPTAGLAAADQLGVLQGIARARQQGVGVLLIEHDWAVVAQLADRVAVLVDGRVLAQGTPACVAADPAVRSAYLGVVAPAGGRGAGG